MYIIYHKKHGKYCGDDNGKAVFENMLNHKGLAKIMMFATREEAQAYVIEMKVFGGENFRGPATANPFEGMLRSIFEMHDEVIRFDDITIMEEKEYTKFMINKEHSIHPIVKEIVKAHQTGKAVPDDMYNIFNTFLNERKEELQENQIPQDPSTWFAIGYMYANMKVSKGSEVSNLLKDLKIKVKGGHHE